jgi:Fe2+ or Zn2+ uptake regulation protein
MQRRYLSPEHERQYFERSLDKETIHVICRQCHRSYTVAGDLLAQFKETIVAQQAWQDLTICSCVSGLCPDCFAKSQATERVEQK